MRETKEIKFVKITAAEGVVYCLDQYGQAWKMDAYSEDWRLLNMPKGVSEERPYIPTYGDDSIA